MDFINTSLEQQPLMALFLTIAIGYLLGEVSVGGLSLGVGMVLFVALGMGCLAPKAAPPAMLGNFGLALFLYAVGIQYGKQFFIGVTSASGLKDNLVALTGVMISGAVALLFVRFLNLKTAYALGLFEKRRRNLRAVLERIVERVDEVEVNAAAVISAVQALAKINIQGQWVDRTEQVNLNELFERMSQQELEAYAREGALPEWFTRTVGVTVNDSANGKCDE